MKWIKIEIIKDNKEVKGANPKGDSSCFQIPSYQTCCDRNQVINK